MTKFKNRFATLVVTLIKWWLNLLNNVNVKLIEKIESVIKRMSWKAFFHLNKNGKNEMETEKIGFKSKNCPPPQCKELQNFEKDLQNIITCIKYRKSTDCFQTKMKEDISKIKASPNVLVFADKMTNIYQGSPSKYNKLLNYNVTKTNKKSTDRLEKSINMEAKYTVKSIIYVNNEP